MLQKPSDHALVQHRVGDLEEAGDVGAVDVVARRAEVLGGVAGRSVWMLFMISCSRLSTSSRVQA